MKSSSAARLAEMELSEDDTDKRELILLGEIDAPSPVFFCSVEPASAAFQKGAVSTHLSHNMGGGGGGGWIFTWRNRQILYLG